MHSKMRRLLSSSLLLCLLAAFALGGTAFAGSRGSAASPSSAPLDLAALQKTCAVLEVHLNGAQHTTRCLHTHRQGAFSSSHGGYLAASIGRDNGCDYNVDTMVIYNYNYTGTLCFSGYGYSGVRIYDVDWVDNTTCNAGNCADDWIKFYFPGDSGTYCTIETIDGYANWNGSEVLITQIDAGSANQYDCPPF